MFFIRYIFLVSLFCFPFFGGAIYNLKTNKAGQPQKFEKKHWLLVSQGCHSCAELLLKLESICSGKKPSIDKIGFFTTGRSPEALLKKLESFKVGYEIFAGSPNEFYETYQILGSPSLKLKGGQKVVAGKDPILKFLKKDSSFCST